MSNPKKRQGNKEDRTLLYTPIVADVKRITTKDNVQLITKKLQSKEWETLEHNADTEALTTFLESTHNYLLLAYDGSQVVGMLTAHRLDKLDARKCEFLL